MYNLDAARGALDNTYIINIEARRDVFVPLKGKRCEFAWFHLEVGKRICLVEFSFGRAVLSLGIVLWCVEKFAEFSFG